jgi:hypothetical protein
MGHRSPPELIVGPLVLPQTWELGATLVIVVLALAIRC